MSHYIQSSGRKSMLPQLLCLFLVASTCHGEPPSSPPEMLPDAGLTDVFFLDVDRGWAVGDRGVILVTTDGGRQWHLADTPVNCRIEAIHFIDGQHGWAVGGWIHPYTHTTTGVVLKSDNGGRRWERLEQPTLPKLRQVRFQDAQRGWAIGSASPMYPAGFFRTLDGGRSWRSVPATQWNELNAADDGGTGSPLAVAAGRAIKVTASNEMRQYLLPASGLRQPRAVRVSGPGSGWIVGDGGLVLATEDHGQTWHQPTSLQLAPTSMIDLTDVATSGGAIWIVGEPGSVVLHSADRGATWSLQKTGQNAPLQAIHFADSQHGWAVGNLGTVLATRDAGRTWIRQRGSESLAVLGLFARSGDIPLEMIAQLAGDEGYLSAAEVVSCDEPRPGEGAESDRVHLATLGVGGSQGRSNWRFPLSNKNAAGSAERIVSDWDIVTGTDSLAQLEEFLVCRIRQWRPEIIVTPHPGSADSSPLNYIVGQAVLAAVQKAADPTSFPEQRDHLGLEPWSVKKVFALLTDETGGSVTLQTSRLATRLGRTLGDYASLSNGLIRTDWVAPQKTLRFELMVSEMPRQLASRGFFHGIPLPPGETRRRLLNAPPAADLKALTKATQKERNVQQLLRHASKNQADTAGWLGQITDLLAQLSPSAGGEALYQLAQQYRVDGHLDLAADTLTHLVLTYPDHVLTEPSLLWLLRFQASAEAKHGLLRHHQREVVRGHTLSNLSGQDPLGRTVIPASATAESDVSAASIIQRSLPNLAAEPEVRSCLAAIARAAGDNRRSLQYSRQLAANQALGAWSQCGRGEVWISDRNGLSPKPLAKCATTDQKPLLDGILDEPFWAAAEIVPLASSRNDDASWKAAIQIARDEEFLYWGVSCKQVPGQSYPESEEPRARDADLTGEDRVELLIDIDRDAATYFRLTVDHRGRTSESCFGDSHWNPQWYVAAHSAETTWTIEAAIPLNELVNRPPVRGETWSVGIQRTIPGVGFQSWTQPAGPEPRIRPEGFGYLRF